MKASIDCKNCQICQPNLRASCKAPKQWVYPSDYECAGSLEFYPALADQCPYFTAEVQLIRKN